MILRELNKAYRFLRALPKSVYFNFKYLEARHAIRLPVLISHRVSLDLVKGRVIVEDPSTFSVRIGFDRAGISDESAGSVWQVSGTVVFKGRTRIGPSAKIVAAGTMVFGDNFNAGSGVSFYCAKEVVFGDGCLLSWDITLMDHDFHEIRELGSDALVNPPKEIVVGNGVWIGCNATLLKGSGCDDGCVVAAGALLNKRFEGANQILGGNPPRVLKQNVYWRP